MAVEVNLLHNIKDVSCQVEVIITLKRRQKYWPWTFWKICCV